MKSEVEYLHEDVTKRIIDCFYEVYGLLGYGFLEKVYEHAMMVELQLNGLCVRTQRRIRVHYKGKIAGDYIADLVVEERVVLELKATEVLVHPDECQLINYLKASDFEVGLLLNFGKRREIRRKIFTNDRKGPHRRPHAGDCSC
jgi:GxxExxY protein